jgi:hypothetical protein
MSIVRLARADRNSIHTHSSSGMRLQITSQQITLWLSVIKSIAIRHFENADRLETNRKMDRLLLSALAGIVGGITIAGVGMVYSAVTSGPCRTPSGALWWVQALATPARSEWEL